MAITHAVSAGSIVWRNLNQMLTKFGFCNYLGGYVLVKQLIGVISCAFSVLLIAACSGGKSEGEGDTRSDIPESFTTTSAIINKVPSASPEHIDISSLLTGPGNNAIWLTGVVNSPDSDRVSFAHRLTQNGAELDEHLAYDTSSQSFTTLATFDLFDSPSISSNLSTVAWIEECQGYVQSVNSPESLVHLNPLIRSESCLRPPRVSDGGETAYFDRARGELGENGALHFAEFDAEEFGPIIYHKGTQNMISLAGQELKLDATLTKDQVPYYFDTDISTNGQLLALRTGFIPECVSSLGEIEFTAGILLVNAYTGEQSFVDQHSERRAFCSKCYFYPATDLVLSGNGNFVYFLRPDSEASLDPTAAVHLYRYDVASSTLDRIPSEDVIDKDSLSVDQTGNHVVYLSNDNPVLLRIDSGERVIMDSAIRLCTENQCEFASFRFVRNNPFQFSDDGASLAVLLIPERAEIDTPQNIEEAYVIDTVSLMMTRVAAGIDIERIELGSSGNLVAFQTSSAGLIPADDDFDSDIFIVRH